MKVYIANLCNLEFKICCEIQFDDTITEKCSRIIIHIMEPIPGCKSTEFLFHRWSISMKKKSELK